MNKVDKIFHIADVHIRNLKRHMEYELVFEKLYKEIENRKTDNSLIVVAGDVVHSKLELSPEVVDMTSRFFRRLSELCDTIVITGNHDCFTGEHEVLTSDGWVRLDEYVDSDMDLDVATFSDKSENIEFEKPTTLIKKKFNGYLKHITGKGVDMLVTPTHDILYQYTQYPDKYYKSKAKDVPTNALIPISSRFDVSDYTDDYYAQLLGFSFADGTFVLKNENTGSCRIQFHLKKDRKVEYLSTLLNKLNYSFNINKSSEDDGSVYINVYSDLASGIFSFFNGSKEIPWSIVLESKNFIFNFLNGYFNGDGYNAKNNFYSFVNVNKSNVELLSTLSRLVGGISNTHFDKEIYGKFENSKRLYSGNCSWGFKRNRTSIKNVSDVEFDGDVYCLTVPNGNLFIRHNDKMFVAGNCNLNNTYRLDALSPIVNNLDIDNLFYYKDSGVYTHGDVSFVVWSVFDDESKYIKASELNTTNTKIGLYHGPVDSARTDVGYVIHNNKVTVDMMDGYDMFLLGDIHSLQEVQEHSEEHTIVDETELGTFLEDGWEIVEEIDE